MPVEAGEIEVRWSSSEHGGRSAVRIVVVSSNYGAAAGEHFADRAEVISRVEVSSRADILALGVITLRHRVRRVAEFAFLLTGPNDLAGGIDCAASLLHDPGDAAQAVVAQLATRCKSSVIDGD